MNYLVRIAFSKARYWALIVLAIVSMGLLTLASQMEIFTMGVLAKRAPSFFELFAPIKDGRLVEVQQIDKKELLNRWEVIDPSKTGVITQNDADTFLQTVERQGFIDRIITAIEDRLPLRSNVINLALFIAAVALFRAITLFTHRYSARLIAVRVSRDLRLDYFSHIQSLSMNFYQKYNIGSLSSRVVSDSLAISEGINAALLNYLQTPFTLITTLALCFATSWRLSLLIFVGCPLIVFPIIYLARKIKRVSKQLLKNQENFANVLIDYLSGILTIKAFGQEEFSLNKYREQNKEMARLEKKSAKYDASVRPIVHTMGMTLIATTLLWGLYVLHMSLPEMFVFCGFLYLCYEPIKKFADVNTVIQRGVAAAERMQEVLQETPQIQNHSNAIPLKEFKDKIIFDNVSFRYEDEWILKDLSFSIPRGKTVALVGPTGGGKSTIVKLLPRLYDPQKGQILIDGKPLTEYTLKSIHEKIAFVPQKPFLFLDSIEDNIAFGTPYTTAEIHHAAKQAHAHDFIEKLPQGYTTQIRDAGGNLSGGQQQRLAIARALHKKSPILILDEATSSLDTVSENAIKEAINELRGQVTQLIIAHRLSTIEDADKIIYLEGGQKIAEGTRDELLKSCLGFKAMWEMMHKTHAKT